jgi:hypothetical protein
MTPPSLPCYLVATRNLLFKQERESDKRVDSSVSEDGWTAVSVTSREWILSETVTVGVALAKARLVGAEGLHGLGQDGAPPRAGRTRAVLPRSGGAGQPPRLGLRRPRSSTLAALLRAGGGPVRAGRGEVAVRGARGAIPRPAGAPPLVAARVVPGARHPARGLARGAHPEAGLGLSVPGARRAVCGLVADRASPGAAPRRGSPPSPGPGRPGGRHHRGAALLRSRLRPPGRGPLSSGGRAGAPEHAGGPGTGDCP